MTSLPVRRDLPSLTGLRYLAAAAVVFCHATHILGPDSVTAQFASLGYVGVEFFFILSGFVLTWSWHPGITKATFYRRRFARIYPLYITTWIAVVVAAQVLDMPDQSTVGALLGVVMLQAWVPVQNIFQAGNTPGWSLSAEAFFYAVFPFLVGRIPKWRWTTIVLVAAISVGGLLYSFSGWYSVWFAYYSPIWGLLFFVIGMTLPAHIRSEQSWVPKLPISLALMVGSFVLLGAFVSDRPKGFIEALMLPSIVLMIVAAGRADMARVQTLWSRPVLIKLGQWSFALYLVHWGILGVAQKFVKQEFGGVGTFLAAAIVLAIATVVSAAAYHFLEHPAERIIRGRRKEEAQGGASSTQVR